MKFCYHLTPTSNTVLYNLFSSYVVDSISIDDCNCIFTPKTLALDGCYIAIQAMHI